MGIRGFVRSLIRENVGISFHTDHTAHYHGQSNFTLSLLVNGKVVAHLDYSVFQGEACIDMIRVHDEKDKRKGYGRMLVNKLAEERGGYEKVEWSDMTPEGAALRKAMDAEKGFDREDHENKHLRKEEVMDILRSRSIDAAKFFDDLTTIGSGTWKKWDSYLRERGYPMTIDGIDLNELHDLSEWTRGSVETNGWTGHEPPEYLIEFLNNIKTST